MKRSKQQTENMSDSLKHFFFLCPSLLSFMRVLFLEYAKKLSHSGFILPQFEGFRNLSFVFSSEFHNFPLQPLHDLLLQTGNIRLRNA